MSDADPQADVPPQVFEIQKLYLKDVSFESPNAPQVFTQEWQPDTDIQLATRSETVQDNVHEVVLTITVTARSNDQAAFLVEVQQAGVFVVSGFPQEQMRHLLGSYCPNVLFPFAREAIAELISKGGFPQMLLSPVNFDALYAEHQRKAQQEGQGIPQQTH